MSLVPPATPPSIPSELPRRALGSNRPTPTAENIVLEGMAVADLLSLRARVDALLPARALKDLDIESELVLQLAAAQQLQNEVLQSDEVPANQQAQVLNSVSSVIGQIVKMQQDLYTTERLKKVERVLIDVLQTLPQETVAEFMNAYETALSR